MTVSSPDTLYSSFTEPRMGALATCWTKVLHMGVRTAYARRAVVKVEEGAVFDLFYVEEGRVQVLFDTLEGRMRSVMSFEPGSLFNLAPCVTRCEASGQYQCLTDAVIWRIPGQLLHDPAFVAQHPELMTSALQILARLTLIYHTFLTDMRMDDFNVGFCRYLLSKTATHGLVFSPGMTQEKMAATLGVHRATLARSIQRLKREHVIEGFTKNRVCILDLKRLRQLARIFHEQP